MAALKRLSTLVPIGSFSNQFRLLRNGNFNRGFDICILSLQFIIKLQFALHNQHSLFSVHILCVTVIISQRLYVQCISVSTSPLTILIYRASNIYASSPSCLPPTLYPACLPPLFTAPHHTLLLVCRASDIYASRPSCLPPLSTPPTFLYYLPLLPPSTIHSLPPIPCYSSTVPQIYLRPAPLASLHYLHLLPSSTISPPAFLHYSQTPPPIPYYSSTVPPIYTRPVPPASLHYFVFPIKLTRLDPKKEMSV